MNASTPPTRRPCLPASVSAWAAHSARCPRGVDRSTFTAEWAHAHHLELQLAVFVAALLAIAALLRLYVSWLVAAAEAEEADVSDVLALGAPTAPPAPARIAE